MKIREDNFTFWENVTLAVCTLMFGIMAGFFWTYTFNVNLALEMVDGPTYAIVQSLLNQNVRHPMFFAFFFGAAAAALITLLTNRNRLNELSFWLVVLATGSYVVGVIVFTQQVNLPINYYTESWQPEHLPTDWQVARTQWNSANQIRVIASGSAFLLGIVAMLMRMMKSAPR